MNRAMDLLELVRYWARGPERAPVGQTPARIEVLTASGKHVLTPKTAARDDGESSGRPTGGAISDDRTV